MGRMIPPRAPGALGFTDATSKASGTPASLGVWARAAILNAAARAAAKTSARPAPSKLWNAMEPFRKSTMRGFGRGSRRHFAADCHGLGIQPYRDFDYNGISPRKNPPRIAWSASLRAAGGAR